MKTKLNTFLLRFLIRGAALFTNAFAFFFRKRMGISRQEWERMTQAVTPEDIARVIAKGREKRMGRNDLLGHNEAKSE